LDLDYVPPGESAVTTRHRNGRVTLRADRPAVLVSGTSWTEDEDFGMLLDALCLVDQQHDTGDSPAARLPRFLVLITGKGPMREMYMRRVEELALRHVTVRSLWLKAEDYPKLLGK
jgi:beta-1,4-mannosyltransferase